MGAVGAVLHQKTLNQSNRGTCGWERAERERGEPSGPTGGKSGRKQGGREPAGEEWGEELKEEQGRWQEALERGRAEGGGCASQLSFPGALAWRGTNSRP